MTVVLAVSEAEVQAAMVSQPAKCLSFSTKSVIVMTPYCHVKMDWTSSHCQNMHNLSFKPNKFQPENHQFWGK